MSKDGLYFIHIGRQLDHRSVQHLYVGIGGTAKLLCYREARMSALVWRGGFRDLFFRVGIATPFGASIRLAALESDHCFDHIAEFADVARPRMRLKGADRFRGRCPR